jgi:hypothetical protein
MLTEGSGPDKTRRTSRETAAHVLAQSKPGGSLCDDNPLPRTSRTTMTDNPDFEDGVPATAATALSPKVLDDSD